MRLTAQLQDALADAVANGQTMAGICRLARVHKRSTRKAVTNLGKRSMLLSTVQCLMDALSVTVTLNKIGQPPQTTAGERCLQVPLEVQLRAALDEARQQHRLTAVSREAFSSGPDDGCGLSAFSLAKSDMKLDLAERVIDALGLYAVVHKTAGPDDSTPSPSTTDRGNAA